MKYRLNCEKEWLDCTKCPLHSTRNKVVIGFGNPKARFMVIGEAPGADEDDEGIPYVGAAGQMLDAFFRFRSLDRSRDLFLNNIVACRPPDNRKPTKEEIAACLPRLQEAIYKVDPFLIIATGATALQSLTGDSTMISKARGELFMAQVPGWYMNVEYPVFAVFHPSFILRNRADKKPGSAMDKTGDDFVTATNLYDMLRHLLLGKPIPER